MGSASNGKTTLARIWQGDDAPVDRNTRVSAPDQKQCPRRWIDSKDYYYLLLGQYGQTSKLMNSNANRRPSDSWYTISMIA